MAERGPKTDTGFDLDMSEVNRGIATLIRDFEDEAPRAMYQMSQSLIGEAQRITPIAEGTLVNSANVERVDDLTYDLGFNTEYAAAVHEREELRHTPPGQAKYLRDAIDQHAERLLAQQTDHLSRRLGT